MISSFMKTDIYKQNKALLLELVRTDFKLRYQGSVLGYMWSLLKPLLLFVILYIVFVFFLKIGKDIEHFPVYLLIGIVLWNFFTEMTVQSLGSIVGRGDLIRKIKIPRWIIVFSTSVSATINLLLSLTVVVIFMLINGVTFTWHLLLAPFYLVLLYFLALGLSFMLAAAYVKYRDLSYIWEIILQAGFYATPIIYPLQLVENVLVQKLLLLSPIAFVIQGIRNNVVTEQALTTSLVWGNVGYTLIPIAITALIFLTGLAYFRKQSSTFAENI